MPRLFALLLALVPSAAQEKSAVAHLGDGAKLEAEARLAATTIGQLTFEIAKIDVKLQAIDFRRKQLEADSAISEAAKDRLAPVIKDLDASRVPLEEQKRRLDGERTRITDRRQLERALEAYRKAVDKAAADGDKANLAKALFAVARTCEFSEADQIAEAQAAYARIVAECADQASAVAEANRKIKLRGVDVILDKYARFVVDWRELLRNSSAPLEAKRKELEARIRAIGKDATPGLIDGFSHRDEIVRAFAADLIAGAADETGIAALIQKLAEGTPPIRAGAGLALSRVFETWSSARAMDREADQILAELDAKDPEDAAAQRMTAALRERAGELKRRATDLRGHLPDNLGNKPEIEAALHKILSDEAAPPIARVEAAKALRSLGEFSGALAEAVFNGLASRERSVREACCIAASGVDPKDSAAAFKLVDRLMEIVKYEPDLDSRPAAERDPANDAGVRLSAATSLGTIGKVKAIPALTEALADADSGVRRGAHDALKRLTGLDFAYEPDPLVSGGPDSTPEGIVKAKNEKRQEGISRWNRWYEETLGAPVLVNRFWQFQAQSKGGEPFRIYDRENYLRELRNRSYTLGDPAAFIARTERVCERFHAGKDRILKEASELGAPAVEKFIALLSGAVPADERLSPDLQAKSRAVTRFFVAEAVAKLIAENQTADKSARLREKVSGGGSKEEKAGAALALGYLPKELSSAEDRETLEKRGLEDPEPEVREAASRALGRVGTPENGPGLAKVAALNASGRAGEAAQLAALRAIAALKPKHEEVIRTCGDLIGDEGSKRSTSSAVRESACDALGAIADPAAIKGLWLFRGRRDIAKPVRDASTRAIAAIAAADPATPEAVAAVVSSSGARSIDRTGAALALGDLSETRTIPALVWQIVDRNPPQALRANDPSVRAVCAEALGNMGEKARYRLVAEKLIDALADPTDLVKAAAIEALRRIAPSPPEEDAFRVKDPDAARAAGIARLRQWLEANRDKWPELPQ